MPFYGNAKLGLAGGGQAIYTAVLWDDGWLFWAHHLLGQPIPGNVWRSYKIQPIILSSFKSGSNLIEATRTYTWGEKNHLL